MPPRRAQGSPVAIRIPARAPAVDREVLRAMLFAGRAGAPWPQSAADLAARVAAAAGRADQPAEWVAAPEREVLAAVLGRASARSGPVAAPAWGPPGWRSALERGASERAAASSPAPPVLWLEPAEGRLDPGPAEVAAALDAGARGVILSPLWGDPAPIPEAARLCAARGVPLALDLRAAAGSRSAEGNPAAFGDLLLLPVDGEPEAAASPCPGAVLVGGGAGLESSGRPTGGSPGSAGPASTSLAIARALAASLGREPRLLRLAAKLGVPVHPRAPAGDAPPSANAPPPHALAAAAARLAQSSHRAEQRARHARTLRDHCGNLAAATLLADAAGCQCGGAWLPLLCRDRDATVAALAALGIPVRDDVADWLAPPSERGPRAREAQASSAFLPLHPFYRPADLRFLAETLRQAALRAHVGDAMADPGGPLA
jgi:hypothetical protein